ncbi:BppU family phage baseplate upper protein [Enterococcus avium]|uniref:BppU family phage baseplate upper protein n=1 Tax=Enterococcus avium TaxID=33945 RepID=A0ABD5F8P4_ENTAV|nr:BppU family phage baseplate upper protein [Enterococcus avium]MDT2514664.1 BppU family phage baseplate upper protein [Enterococcus avium]
MFKTNEEIIIIQAKAATPIPTGVVFWSHDKGTAKMLFQLQKDYVNQTLSEGTIVPICLDFVGGRHIYHAVIEDAINGIVSIVLEDNILGYVGRVTGSIYIELPDSRSLDTAGRFTFDIKRSPIDLNTPELEDYYWQGFNEIIDEYHQTINTIKSEAKALLDSITADVTTAQSKITQLEQSITTANTNLNARIDEINQKIDDNDVFTKAESSANVINIVTGKKEVELTFVLDLKDKIAGSDVENKHSYRYVSLTDGILPATPIVGTEVGNTGDWEDYGLLYDLDNKIFTTTTATAGKSAAHVARWNLLEEVKEFLGDKFFTAIGATDVASQVAFIRSKGTSLVGNTWGFGSSASGNKLSCGMYRQRDKDWPYNSPNTQNSVKKMSSNINPSSIPFYIADDGFVTEIAYAEPSDGVTQSATRVDYSNLEFKMKISMSEYFNSLIAANHGEKIATQEEAEAGTDNTKTMTPLRTAQQLEKKAVTIAGNQTIGGIKNFKDGLMINDVSLSTITRKVIYEADGVGGYFNAADKFTLGASGKIDKIVLLWSRVDDTAGTLLNYSWSQTVLSPDDLVVGNSYRIQMTTDNYKFVTFANESGNVTISGANENSVAPNRIYRIKRIIAYLKN